MSDEKISLPGDPYDDCDGCQFLLYEKRQLDFQVAELETSIRTLLIENARLTKAINEMPEWERAVKTATSDEITQLRDGLREALTMCVKEHGTDDDYDRLCKLAETGVLFPTG